MDSEEKTPFNLLNLRANMTELIAARQHLLTNPLSRQKLVEESAIEDARDRLEHGFERLEQQGLGNINLTKKKSIQKWMWEWHNALIPRLEEEIKAVLAHEEKIRREYWASFFHRPLVNDRLLMSLF